MTEELGAEMKREALVLEGQDAFAPGSPLAMGPKGGHPAQAYF